MQRFCIFQCRLTGEEQYTWTPRPNITLRSMAVKCLPYSRQLFSAFVFILCCCYEHASSLQYSHKLMLWAPRLLSVCLRLSLCLCLSVCLFLHFVICFFLYFLRNKAVSRMSVHIPDVYVAWPSRSLDSWILRRARVSGGPTRMRKHIN